MILDNIVSELGGCAGLASAVRADSVSEQTVEPAAVLYSLLSSTFSNRLYPVLMPESPSFPNCVYQKVSSNRIPVDGFEMIRTDSFVLQIRQEEYSDLVTTIDTVRNLLITYTSASNVGSIEITDVFEDYDYDNKVYLTGLEIEVTHLTASSQAINAAYVYIVSAGSDESILDNLIKQEVTESYAVTLICNSSNLETLRGQVQACLLGYQPETDGWGMEYASGTPIGVFAHISIWRETFTVTRYIQES